MGRLTYYLMDEFQEVRVISAETKKLSRTIVFET